jgi:uncharacterized membrane protein YjdF
VAWPLALTAVVTWESVSAVPSVGPPWLSFDKLAHFGVFGLLATTVARLEPARRWPLLGPLWAIVLVSVYGMAIEFLQSLTPMRSMEYDDWVADTLGAAVAVVLYLRWTWYRRLLERPTGRPPGSRHQTGSNNAAALSGESGSTLRGAGHCEERGDEAIQAKPDPSELDRHDPQARVSR